MQLKWKIIWLLGNNLEAAKAFADLFFLFFCTLCNRPEVPTRSLMITKPVLPPQKEVLLRHNTLRIREALPPSSCWLGIKVYFTLTFNGQHVESTPYKWHRPWLESQQQFVLHPGFPPVVWHKQIWPFFIPSRFKSSRSVVLCGWHHEKNPESAHCNRTSWALDLTLTHTRTHTSARWQASAVDHHFPFDKSNQMEPEKKKMKAVQRRSH